MIICEGVAWMWSGLVPLKPLDVQQSSRYKSVLHSKSQLTQSGIPVSLIPRKKAWEQSACALLVVPVRNVRMTVDGRSDSDDDMVGIGCKSHDEFCRGDSIELKN